MMNQEAETHKETKSPNGNFRIFGVLVAATFLIYYFSNPNPQGYYDYTFRVADNFLRGAIGFQAKQPSWLNEFVPFGGKWYSVFPLGSVLTMIPFAFFKSIGVIKDMPAALIAALTASGICFFLIKTAEKYEHDLSKKLLTIGGILFGTWMWTNETMAGAWHLALGFAMLGELGAIYFTVYNRKPVLAGLCFALAFGNRTEILLTAPIFMYLMWNSRFQIPNSKLETEADSGFQIPNSKLKSRKSKTKDQKQKTEDRETENSPNQPNKIWNLESGIWNRSIANRKSQIANLIKFCLVPFVLGVATLLYNYVRFDSLADFGYARIPGVLDEPWYEHGIFSIWYIPDQAYQMLFKLWLPRAEFPFLLPDGFSASILWSSPFILFVLRTGARDKILVYAAWAAIVLLTFLLWMHGNAGGWQFGYRYAMVLLPWMFVILLETSPKKVTALELFAYALSILINLYATYLFHWTNYIKP